MLQTPALLLISYGVIFATCKRCSCQINMLLHLLNLAGPMDLNVATDVPLPQVSFSILCSHSTHYQIYRAIYVKVTLKSDLHGIHSRAECDIRFSFRSMQSVIILSYILVTVIAGLELSISGCIGVLSRHLVSL